jgi:LETM1 and EF-hand domain-containing protein 1
MSLNRAASRAAPLLLRQTLRGSRHLPSKIPAIAILIPRRHLNTEHTPRTGTTAPPPGFSIEQAKKPLSVNNEKDPSLKDGEKGENSQDAASRLVDEIVIPSGKAAAGPEGAALQDAALTELATAKAAHEKAAIKKKDENKKLTVWQKVKKEAAHYWDGTKLLAAEVKISSRLALKMAAGYELTRRENRQASL